MRRLLTVLLLAVAATGVLWSPARAHNVLISSDPKDGATLTAPPERVTLVFDQAVRQGYAQVGVTSADGGSWADGAAVVAAERVTVQVKPLPAGSYTVGYRILSADGHPVTGKIGFTVTAGGAAAPATPPAAQEPGSDAAAAEAAANGGAGMAVVWVLGALVVLAIGTVVALRRSAPAAPAAPAASGTAGPAAPVASTASAAPAAPAAAPSEAPAAPAAAASTAGAGSEGEAGTGAGGGRPGEGAGA
ncbi:copper resistance CopC family protein [Nonomuraea sp. N2-4H]|uniref:copper resistance CopC family protein n=1 Tax=Nonomuraea sp. N2-4H TaxID=3128898 RepID=UPI0032562C85